MKHPSFLPQFFLGLALFFALAFGASAAGRTVVYLADGGAGDGSAPDKAVGSLADAYAALDLDRDCTVVVSGVYTQTEDFALGSDYSGSVTFTSRYGTTDYRAAGAAYRFSSVGFACYGQTGFENLDFEALETGFLLVGQHHPVRIGEGCVMRGAQMTGGTIANSFAIIGGYDNGIGTKSFATAADTDITVLSGNQIYVVAYSRNIRGSYTGTANVLVGGTAALTALHGSAAYPSDVCVGDLRAVVAGDASVQTVYGCTQRTTQNSFTLIWKSGKIGAFRLTAADGYTPSIYAPTLLAASDAAAKADSFAAVAKNFDIVLRAADAPDNLAVFPAKPSERRSVAGRALDTDYTVWRVRSLDGKPVTAAVCSVRFPFDAATPRIYSLDGSNLHKQSIIAAAGRVDFTLQADGLYVLSAAPILLRDADSGSTEVRRGDLNGDGVCNLFDIFAALRYLSGDRDGIDPAAINMDKDGVVDLRDVLLLLRDALNARDADDGEDVDSAYNVIAVSDYMDKTTSGFVAQLVAFFSGYEFAVCADATPRLAMPDAWYEMCNGPYADPKPQNPREDKLLFNEETGLWEAWNDDDYSIDILDQFILRDSYAQYGTFAQKTITDGWVKYDVYDMGGGQRSVGAYALMNKYRYLPAFAGSAEFGNWYSVNGEPYIGNETLGMDAAGMPDTAVRLAEAFGSTTSDRDPVLWLKYFAAMYAMAYFEEDIPTLLTEAKVILPEGGWHREVVDRCFALYARYPDNWRQAIIEADTLCYRPQFDKEGKIGENSINCAYIVLGLLYGDGDYNETCKVISLAGHGGDSTTPVALSIVGIINGMQNLPKEANEKIWQDGKGVIVNLPMGDKKGYWMYCAGLPERFAIPELVEMYRENFEQILAENGGFKRNGYYYIPKETLRPVDAVWCEDFESGSAEGWKITGTAAVSTEMPMSGSYAATVTGASLKSSIYKTVDGFTVGETYRMTAYVSVSDGTVATLFARAAGAKTYAQTTVLNTTLNGTQRFAKRELFFTATAESMEIGLALPGTTASTRSASVDDITILRTRESRSETTVRIAKPNINHFYTGTLNLAAEGGTGKEVYLKLNFANANSSLLRAKISINGVEYATAPFFKTGSTKQADNVVYIPLVLPVGESSITFGYGTSRLYVYGAEIVTRTDAAPQ